MSKTLIFAGRFEQARNYARDKNLHPSEWVYLDRIERLRGSRNVKIVTCGTWFDRKDRYEIEDEVEHLVKFHECILVSDTLPEI